MTPASSENHLTRSAEQRARDVVSRIVGQAEPIPGHLGGGHRLDMQLLYEEVVAALRETIDDLAFCTGPKSS
ncbi:MULTISPECIES: hypothetical protein [Roseibium]|jgi:hypothetical protein|uniref:Uncharacterized protein n=1 Tax=Roseibium aggregatum (strain ATCC 25650 / DSM 13394 / JCM 20685 / NBRC 16684 / NCIMB 2208 / IAM 12614 / B1) TaxID=384765 RepID=A0NX00_ROSAI|nr:hypothetical protein [Roseibium aggregatum]EAV42636.1 hypothetical protein SIAM614_26778 [Stappia aggregata IAM 12614] [Roseibium aggregatum IAM 12614]MEE4013079.1 hypothetical protein [Roseibium sp. FZY0029]